jgi:hypothetical protein
MTNSIDFRITRQNIAFLLNFALGRNRTRDPRVPEPKRTPLGYILVIDKNINKMGSNSDY